MDRPVSKCYESYLKMYKCILSANKYKIRARNVVIRAHSHSCILEKYVYIYSRKRFIRNFARSLSYFGSIRRQKVEINQHMQKYFPFFKYKAFPFQSVTFQRCNLIHLKKTFIYSCIYTQLMDVNQNDSFKIYDLIRQINRPQVISNNICK